MLYLRIKRFALVKHAADKLFQIDRPDQLALLVFLLSIVRALVLGSTRNNWLEIGYFNTVKCLFETRMVDETLAPHLTSSTGWRRVILQGRNFSCMLLRYDGLLAYRVSL